MDEMERVEEWTGMKMGNIIFDSDIDNWKQGTSVFDQKVINKSNLIFLIEDGLGNLFGGYVSAVISKVYIKYDDAWTNDPKSFLFSLKSNGRLNGMLKFDITDEGHAFWLGDKSNFFMFGFGFGCDIDICKEDNKYKSETVQKSFEFNGIPNALCGKRKFIPKRITVIQLI